MTVHCATDVRLTRQSTVPTLDFPQWQPQCQAALTELNHRKLLERVTEAEYAIYQRLHSLEGTLNCESRLYRSFRPYESAFRSCVLSRYSQCDTFSTWRKMGNNSPLKRKTLRTFVCSSHKLIETLGQEQKQIREEIEKRLAHSAENKAPTV